MYLDEAVVPYFLTNVVTTYNRYVELSKNEDRFEGQLEEVALHSAHTLFRFRHYVANLHYPKSFTREDVVKLCPDFDWVADAAKLSNLDLLVEESYPNETPKILYHKLQIEETIMNSFYPYEGEVVYPRVFSWFMDLRIMANPLPGKGDSRDLLEINTNVYNFWIQFIKEKFGFKDLSEARYEGNDVKIIKKKEEGGPTTETKMSLPHSRKDGYQFCMIARRFEPRTNEYEEVGFNKDGGIDSLPVNQTGNPITKIYGAFDRLFDSSIPQNAIIQLQKLVDKAQESQYSPEQFTSEAVAIDPTLKFLKDWIIPKDQTAFFALLAILVPLLAQLLSGDDKKATVINNYNTYVMPSEQNALRPSLMKSAPKNTNLTPPKKKRKRIKKR